MASFAVADPPYPGQAKKRYADQPDYAGEVDHHELLGRLKGYDGWALHTSSVALADVLTLCDSHGLAPRVAAWVKPFAAFKRNIPVAYAWEPVLFSPIRKQVVGRAVTPLRDWVAESITLKRGLTGAKPENVCWHVFEWLGCETSDEIHDLFPGTGAVTRAWETWKQAAIRAA